MDARKSLSGLFLVIAVATEAAMALSGRGERSVTVHAHGPAGLRIEGKSSEVSFEQDPFALIFKVPIAPIETGIGLRDRHLRDMLEATRFPAAILSVSRSGLTFPQQGRPAEGTAHGELTLHGRSRPVKVAYRAELGSGGITSVRGSMQLDIRDFDVVYPFYLGMTISPQVEIDVELTVDGL